MSVHILVVNICNYPLSSCHMYKHAICKNVNSSDSGQTPSASTVFASTSTVGYWCSLMSGHTCYAVWDLVNLCMEKQEL